MKMINNTVSPARLDSIRLGGVTGKTVDFYIEGRFLSDFAKRVIFEEALAPFRDFADDAKGTWRGEFWGKHILGAVEAYKYTQSEELKEFLRNQAYKILRLAREDGYVNTYSDSLNLYVNEQSIKNTESQVNIPWNWNLWCRKYTLWGLIGIYEITFDEKILSGALALALQAVRELTASKVDLRDTGMFFGLPSSSIIKPLLLLYRYTESRELLTFVKDKIISAWESEDGRAPNIIKNSLEGRPVASWYKDPALWAKAYEMMSCFEGILEYYRISGDEKYLSCVKSFYDLISKYEKNPLHSVAYNDMFSSGAECINAVSEPCDSIHYMRLSYELYLITGELKYIDDFELTYYNAFLAGVYTNELMCARAVRFSGSHMRTKQGRMTHHHCCLDNAPRALMRIAEVGICTDDNSVNINLFDEMSSVITLPRGMCKADIRGGYFKGDTVRISLSMTGEIYPINIRIPSHSPHLTLRANAEIKKGKDHYTVIPKESETVIYADFHMKPRLYKLESSEECKADKWYFDRWYSSYAMGKVDSSLFLNGSGYVLQYGALLLSRSKLLGSEEDEVMKLLGIDTGYECHLTPISVDGFRAAFNLSFTDGERAVSTVVGDFASSSNKLIDDGKLFNLYF